MNFNYSWTSVDWLFLLGIIFGLVVLLFLFWKFLEWIADFFN